MLHMLCRLKFITAATVKTTEKLPSSGRHCHAYKTWHSSATMAGGPMLSSAVGERGVRSVSWSLQREPRLTHSFCVRSGPSFSDRITFLARTCTCKGDARCNLCLSHAHKAHAKAICSHARPDPIWLLTQLWQITMHTWHAHDVNYMQFAC
jgi:hypothetical protein